MELKSSLAWALVAASSVFAGWAQEGPIERSPLFVKQTDPSSGVVSYLLKPGTFAFSQQSTYFTHRSLTDDGRFLLFYASGPEAADKAKDGDKQLWILDVEKGTAYSAGLPDERRKPSMWIDVKSDRLYWICDDGFFVEDLADPKTARKLFDLPANYRALGEKKTHCMHLTLSDDCKTAFLDSVIREPRKWVQGALDLETGAYVKWSETYYELAHGQINPADPTVGLVALQPKGDKTKAADIPADAEYITHVFGCTRPGHRCHRMHLVRPDQPVEHVMIPEGTHATHEIWARDGKGLYWCDNGSHPQSGVWYRSLATGVCERIVPLPAAHASMSADNRYVVYDRSIGRDWRGTAWRVGFYNRETGRNVFIHTRMDPLVPKERPSRRHPDPHPHFGMNDRYVVCTFNNADGHMDLSVTPVAQLVEKTTETESVRALGDFPAGARPAEVAAKVTDLLFTTVPEAYRTAGCDAKRKNYGGGKVMYCTVSLWANALKCARRFGDRAREEKLLKLYGPYLPGGEKAKCCPTAHHVDFSIYGALPLEVYRLGGDPRALRQGLAYADTQWAEPEENPPKERRSDQNLPYAEQLALWKNGYTPQTRYWIDDMYMITFLQMQAWRATQDRKYLRRVAKEIALYIRRLQRPDGLFDHAPGVPFVWGRGDGWVAGGLAELIEDLPFNDPDYPTVLNGYLKMMKSLGDWQRANGLWGQLVNDPDSWDETSGSAMFAFAMAVGVRKGLLDAATYAPKVRRAYLALVAKLDADGNLRDVCDGTVKKNDRDHYLARPRVVGAPYGQAAVLWLCRELAADSSREKPLFTAGFMSDTHVDPSPGSCDRVRAAYEFFKSKGVSLIANLGDIADRHYPEAYRAYRQVRESVYPDAASRPREVFLWAHHDRTHFRGRENGDYTAAFEAAKPILGIGHEQIDRFEMGGYTFLIFPQWIDKRLDVYEKNIAEACAANPGKPVFVLNHVPPADTTEGTRGCRDRERRILDRYPQVVVFSGHTHGTLRDERLIWQKGFVNVNLGCLSRWGGNFLGRVPPPVQVWTVAYLEFYRDRLVVRRFSLKDGSEIGADDPWTIRWGVDDGRYAPEVRAKGAPEPKFPAGAVPAATADGDPMQSVNVTWPAGGPDRGVLGYRLRVETCGDGGWQTLAVRETCSDFCRETNERAARTFTDCLPAAFFDEGARYRFSVEPYGFYGKTGSRISAEWTAPKKAEADPLCALDSGLPVLHGGEKFLLPKCVQDMPPQTPMRAIVDAESEHGVDESLSFRIQGYPVKEVVSGWAHTEPGKVFRRYVIDFKRGSGKQLIYLAAPFSKPELTLKLMRLRIERE